MEFQGAVDLWGFNLNDSRGYPPSNQDIRHALERFGALSRILRWTSSISSNHITVVFSAQREANAAIAASPLRFDYVSNGRKHFVSVVIDDASRLETPMRIRELSSPLDPEENSPPSGPLTTRPDDSITERVLTYPPSRSYPLSHPRLPLPQLFDPQSHPSHEEPADLVEARLDALTSKLKSEAQRFTKEKDVLLLEQTSLQLRLDAQTLACAALTAEKASLIVERNARLQDHSSLTASLAAEKTKNDILDIELKAVNKRLSRMTTKLESRTEKYTALVSRLEKCMKENKLIRAENASLASTLDIQTPSHALQNEAKHLRETLSTMNDRLEEMERRVGDHDVLELALRACETERDELIFDLGISDGERSKAVSELEASMNVATGRDGLVVSGSLVGELVPIPIRKSSRLGAKASASPPTRASGIVKLEAEEVKHGSSHLETPPETILLSESVLLRARLDDALRELATLRSEVATFRLNEKERSVEIVETEVGAAATELQRMSATCDALRLELLMQKKKKKLASTRVQDGMTCSCHTLEAVEAPPLDEDRVESYPDSVSISPSHCCDSGDITNPPSTTSSTTITRYPSSSHSISTLTSPRRLRSSNTEDESTLIHDDKRPSQNGLGPRLANDWIPDQGISGRQKRQRSGEPAVSLTEEIALGDVQILMGDGVSCKRRKV